MMRKRYQNIEHTRGHQHKLLKKVRSLTVTCIRKHCQWQFYVVDLQLLFHGHVSRVDIYNGSGCSITVKLSVCTAQCAASYRQRILSAAACTRHSLPVLTQRWL